MIRLVFLIFIQFTYAEYFRTCIIRGGGSIYCSNHRMIEMSNNQITQTCEFFKYDAMLCSTERDYCGCAIRPGNCTDNSTDVFVPLPAASDQTVWIIFIIMSVLVCFTFAVLISKIIHMQKRLNENDRLLN